MKRTGMLTVLTMTGLAAATLALAGKDAAGSRGEASAAGPAATKIHMIAAIAIAESTTHGRAMQAELEFDGERPAYEVEVLVGRAIRKITIDADTGEVLNAEDDDADAAQAKAPKAGEVRRG